MARRLPEPLIRVEHRASWQVPVCGVLAAVLMGLAASATGVSAAVACALSGATLVVFVGALAAVIHWRPAGFSAALRETAGLRRSGQRAMARQRCEALVTAAGWRISARALARWELALIHLMDGNLDLALGEFGRLERIPLRMALPSIHRRVPAMVAFCFALNGWLDESEAALKEHRRRCGEEPTEEWLLAWAVATCRRGTPEEVVALLDREWPRIDAGRSGDLVGILQVIRAFATHRVGGKSAEVDGTAVSDGWTRSWRELADWIDTRANRGSRNARAVPSSPPA